MYPNVAYPSVSHELQCASPAGLSRSRATSRGAYCTLISFCGNSRRAAARDGERTRPRGYFIPSRG